MQPTVDILIFGGAFDPPHVGHTTVVQEVLAANYAQQVVIMPVGQHPFDKHLSPASHRLAMVQHAFASLQDKYPERLLIDTFELGQKNISFTYHTVTEYKNIYPNKTIGILIGSDNVAAFDSWKFSQELRTESQIFVYPRAGYDVTQDMLQGMVLLTDVSVVKSASSTIRKELLQTKVSEFVDPMVLQYILQNNLLQYWDDDATNSNN